MIVDLPGFILFWSGSIFKQLKSIVKYILKSAATLFFLLALVGCASSGAIKNASPLSTNRPVSLDFILVETSSSLNGLDAENFFLKDTLITGLGETGLFGSISGNLAGTNSSSGIKVKADIKEIQKVSDSARLWMGAFAGRARILLQVTVTDLNSGYQIETFEAEGVSGKSARAGTTDEAIQRAVDVVVAEMVKISRQTSQ